MLKGIRHMKMSLAAKCQLLFGAAVVLILSAALFVPWQRMEQLMEQMNERTAHMLAEREEANHIVRQIEATSPPSAARMLIEQPASGPAPRHASTVRMILAKTDVSTLPRFEARAMERFRTSHDSDHFARTQDRRGSQPSYKYAHALRARPSCIMCHKADLAATTQPSKPDARHSPLLGIVSVEIPYQVEANQLFVNRIFIFLAWLLGGALAIIVFYFITTRLILDPVRVLQKTAERVSEGSLDIRCDISTGDEFEQFAETINRMLANLKQGEDQLRAINTALDLKLEQMAESNLALYESNRLKSEFLANVSHELRTPLNSILGFAELLRDQPLANDPKAGRFVQNITNSGKHLLTLITDLLDLAKIEAGRMEVRAEPLSLGDLFEGLVSIIRPLAEKKGLSIVTTVGREVPITQSDPAKLQQILYNFLSNAIKFSPEGGRIDLKAERQAPDTIRIAVTDQGPGIEPEKQSLIFEKFRQIDGSVTREHGGTGLGLAISRELILLLGGAIGLQSRTGEGATFWITLPIKAEKPEVPGAAPAPALSHNGGGS